MADYQNELKRIAEQMQASIAQAREQLKANFGDACKELFDKLPELQAFGWRQYTPYFNDGDECVFGRDDFAVLLYGDDAEDYDWLSESWYNDDLHSRIQTEINNFFDGLPEDEYRYLFGNHVSVVIDRINGVSIEEYTDHD